VGAKLQKKMKKEKCSELFLARTKNNSLREHQSVVSSIRLKASFQQMSNLHPYWLHQLFLVTPRAKAQSATAHAKPCGIRK